MKRRTFLQRTVGAALATLTAFYVPGKPWEWLQDGEPISFLESAFRHVMAMSDAQPRLNTLTLTELTERVAKIEAATPGPVNTVLASPAHFYRALAETNAIPEIIRLTPPPP